VQAQISIGESALRDQLLYRNPGSGLDRKTIQAFFAWIPLSCDWVIFKHVVKDFYLLFPRSRLQNPALPDPLSDPAARHAFNTQALHVEQDTGNLFTRLQAQEHTWVHDVYSFEIYGESGTLSWDIKTIEDMMTP
jgi:hypothetical protein